MPAAPDLLVVAGRSPLVLVAPHGGGRDPVRRPWGRGARKVNDLHTATLTAELAATTGAAALINADGDRNDVDLNRLSAAHDHAPHFLERLGELLDAALARHGHAVVATIHGWNVVQPAVDVGLGCGPGEVAGGAVSARFAATILPALQEALETQGITATLGARYPARARENLVQLFTTRYGDDPRPLVRALAARGARCEALQLECGIPLRWPGVWRQRLVHALATTLVGPGLARPAADAPPQPDAAVVTARRTLQFTAPGLSGLAGLDPAGGRLLLFPADGDLVLFTGERVRRGAPDRVGALVMTPAEHGALHLAYDGPVLRFPDTTPFLDLEHGLGRATLGEAQVTLRFAPRHAAAEGEGEFGRVTGRVVIDGDVVALDGLGFADDRLPLSGDARLRGALALGDGRALVFAVAGSGETSGFVCAPAGHVALAGARVHSPAPDRLAVAAELVDGERVGLTARTLGQLPVVRQRSGRPARARFVICAVGGDAPAGWCEIDGF